MRFVFKFNGQPLFDGIYDFQDERDKDDLLLHLQMHLGRVEAMRSFSTTGVRRYDQTEAAAWLNASPAVGRVSPPLPAPPQRAPAVQFQTPRVSTPGRPTPSLPAAPQNTPGLKPDGTVTVNLMSNSVRLFGQPVCFQDEAQCQQYAYLLRRFVQNLKIIEAGKKRGVAPNPGEWSLWLAHSRHPGWQLGTHLLNNLHVEQTGGRASSRKSTAPPGGNKKQNATRDKKKQAGAAANQKKEPSPVASKNRRPYFLWAGEQLLNTTPVRLTPDEIARLLGLLRHCVHPPETVIWASPHPKETVGALFKRTELYAWCRDRGQFDLPRLARCLELIARPEPSREPSRKSETKAAPPKTPTPDPSRKTASPREKKAPVWPGQHPRPHEWATSDRIEFNVMEYK